MLLVCATYVLRMCYVLPMPLNSHKVLLGVVADRGVRIAATNRGLLLLGIFTSTTINNKRNHTNRL